mgnify:CR=1 FL=1
MKKRKSNGEKIFISSYDGATAEEVEPRKFRIKMEFSFPKYELSGEIGIKDLLKDSERLKKEIG